MKSLILLLISFSCVAQQSAFYRAQLSNANSSTLTLSLSFTGTTLDNRIVAVNSNGTVYNSSGILVASPSNTPRQTYDPVTLVSKGVLIEESRTNYATSINNWLTFDAGLGTGSTGKRNVTSYRVTEDGSNSSHVTYQNFTVPSTTNIAVSVLVKQGTRRYGVVKVTNGSSNSWASTVVDLQTGVLSQTGVTGSGTIPTATFSIKDRGDGWYRVGIAAVYPSANTSYQIGVGTCNTSTTITDQFGDASYAGDGGSYIDADCGQMEVGTSVSSIILTTTASVTRGADNINIPRSTWWNDAQGTMVTVHNTVAMIQRQLLYCFLDTNPNRFALRANESANSGLIFMSMGTTGAGGAQFTGAVNDTNYKVAMTYTSTGHSMSVNGGTVSNGTQGFAIQAGGTYGTLAIGNNNGGGGYLNGHIMSLKYYKVNVNNATLQSL